MAKHKQLVESRVWSGNQVVASVQVVERDDPDCPYTVTCLHPVSAREVHLRFAEARDAEGAAERLVDLYEDARAAIEGAAKPFDDVVTEYEAER